MKRALAAAAVLTACGSPTLTVRPGAPAPTVPTSTSTTANPPSTTTSRPPAPTTTTSMTAAPTTTVVHVAVASIAPASPVPTVAAAEVPAAGSDPYTTAAYPAVGMAPRNATEACISEREHGGSYSRSSNPSHFGRWQFSTGLWSAYAPQFERRWPGITGRWGSAGPAEQDAVFVAVVAADGYAPWTPYDGC